MVIEIPLSKTSKNNAGKYVAIVDDCDAEFVLRFNWQFNNGYAVRDAGYYKSRIRHAMHREIVERILGHSLEKGQDVDHINGNGLDNRRENLRAATRSQNQGNRKLSTNNASGFKGVSWVKRDRKWKASIKATGKTIIVGCFDTPEEAHVAYCKKAKELFGEFANDGNAPIK